MIFHKALCRNGWQESGTAATFSKIYPRKFMLVAGKMQDLRAGDIAEGLHHGMVGRPLQLYGTHKVFGGIGGMMLNICIVISCLGVLFCGVTAL